MPKIKMPEDPVILETVNRKITAEMNKRVILQSKAARAVTAEHVASAPDKVAGKLLQAHGRAVVAAITEAASGG